MIDVDLMTLNKSIIDLSILQLVHFKISKDDFETGGTAPNVESAKEGQAAQTIHSTQKMVMLPKFCTRCGWQFSDN